MAELYEDILQFVFLLLNKEIGTLADGRVQLEEQLIINEVSDGVRIVLQGKHLVHEGEREGLIPEVVVYRLGVFAHCTWRKVN